MPPLAEIKEKPKPYIFGRPTKYKPELCQQLIDFFSVKPYEEVDIPHYKGGELSWTDTKRVPNDIPTLTAFCSEYTLGWRTVHNWIDPTSDYFQPDFLHAYTHARAIRTDFLNNGAWNSVCPPNTFKFIAVNLTDMRDKTEVEVSKKDSIADWVRETRKQIESVEVKTLPEGIKNPITAIPCRFEKETDHVQG